MALIGQNLNLAISMLVSLLVKSIIIDSSQQEYYNKERRESISLVAHPCEGNYTQRPHVA